MSQERHQILEMLAKGKITADEAEKLLDAIGGESRSDDSTGSRSSSESRPKCLKIQVEPKGHREGSKEKVNIKIPLALVRAGIKLGSLVPGDAREKVNEALAQKGIKIDINELDLKSVDNLVESLSDLKINVESDDEDVNISCC
jgi:polyhydroxyalkanoate synthesis regulator phasin